MLRKLLQHAHTDLGTGDTAADKIVSWNQCSAEGTHKQISSHKGFENDKIE